jgi:hypothetical protein
VSINDAIATFATGTYTVTRTGAGSYSGGILSAGSTSSFSIVASVQPLSGRDLQVLPEGQRTDETRVLYTTTQLLTRTATQAPDSISIDGSTYEVFKVEDWTYIGVTHYRAYVSRKDRP